MTKREYKGKYVTVWPQYFDSTLSRRYGRRVPKELSVPKPTTKEIIEVLNSLNRKYVVLEGKYPRIWWHDENPVAVEKKEGERKTQILHEIARELYRKRFKKEA
ncbi:signal recognition particle [Ignicoccus islandicus DSM 13165]|uniref:Signal recognition particle 19 kDa protein n=1 Tax=Ignicoccus islandicus DSM 13165 TaxID=940295 RepID=A0A0U3F6B1_9CREN|nr:signal recognition particle subunit SRP19/SEC65 family protein [Ignicoccus islandicus]ALU11608.1 signal recognition particle [Ignicoccus islandicus DSM 13165]